MDGWDLVDYMKVVGILTMIALLIKILLMTGDGIKYRGHYTKPEWNFFIKKIYAEYVVRRKKHEDQRIVRTLKKYESEEPKILPQEISSDSQLLYGSDQSGNYLLVKFTRLRHQVAEIWIILKLSNGDVYTFPKHPNTRTTNATPRTFEAAGLKLEFLIPYQKMRITFNGFLKKGIHNDSQGIVNEDDLYYVKFNFFWTAASNPLFWPFDWSPKLMATALATERWRDGKWKNMIVKKNSGGYDQFGSLFGQVRVHERQPENMDFDSYFTPKFQEFEMNLPGLRQRRWGVNKVKHLHRTGVLMGVAVDGTVFEVGALSAKLGLTHTQFGSVRLPNGSVYPIDWTNFHLSAIAEYQDESPQSIIIKFEASGEKFNLFISFKNNQKVRLFGGEPIDWNAFVIPMEIAINSQTGYGLATFWYPRSDFEDFKVEEVTTKIKRVFYRLDRPNPSHMVITQDELVAQSLFISGGKGASLAILKQIEENAVAHFLARNDNEQILNALIDPLSANPLKRSLQKKHTLHDHAEPKRNRSGSDAQTVFSNPKNYHFNFSVPQFFVLSTSAMKQHIKTNAKLLKVLKDLEETAVHGNHEELKVGCELVSAEFFKTTLNISLQEELKVILASMRDRDSTIRFAVRSSCILEDGEHTSSAGQNETFLGLNSDDEVIEGILQCWISLFSYQSVTYRIQHIQPVISEMAVVIQEMIPAEVAGVLFTAFPTNGDPHKMMITANWGLGQTVVSGQVDPDTFIVGKSYTDGLTVLASKMGDKKITCLMDDVEIAKEIETDEKKQKVFCMNEGMILKLARVGVILEKIYGSPRDIEWAIWKNKIYILQARPITGLSNFSNFELLHENDGSIMSNQDLLTKANIGEAFPGAISLFTQSTLPRLIEKSLHRAMGSEIPNVQLFSKFFFSSHHNMFMDVYSLILRHLTEKITVMNKAEALTLFGYDYITPEIHKTALRRNHRGRSSSGIKMFYLMIKNLLRSREHSLENLFRYIEQNVTKRYSEENLARFKVSIDLFKDLEEALQHLEIIFLEHNSFSQASMFYQMIAFNILTQGSKALTTTHQNDIALILGSIKEVESAEIPEILNEVAGKIILHGKKDEFLAVENKKAPRWLEENCPEAFKHYEYFMQKHGHRGLVEMDFMQLPYNQNIPHVIEMIKANVNIEWDFNPAGGKVYKHHTNETIIENLRTPLSTIPKFLMSKVLPKAKDAVRNRERTKSKAVMSCNEIRNGIRGLGKLMVNEGFLPESELIFHMTKDEIKKVILFRDVTIISKAIRRQNLYPQWAKYRFPDLNFGVPRPMTFYVQSSDSFNNSNILVKGTIVCGGIVEGRACVLQDFSEVHKIQKGDILVTYSTDIGWSPYFPLLRGLCTELGGLISHAAVVSRECNLPCIVGAKGATSTITTGRTILLNADEGCICSVD